MAVRIETVTAISVDGVDLPWKVHGSCLKDVDGRRFLRLPGSNCPPLMRLLFGTKPPRGMNLAQHKGLSELKVVRNKAQLEVFESSSAAEVFDAAQPIKKTKVSHGAQSSMRESPEVMDMPLGDTGNTIKVIRPCHPGEDVWAELDDATIAAVLDFVKSFSDVVVEAKPREYNKQRVADKRVWKMGGGRSARVNGDGIMSYIRPEPPQCDQAPEQGHEQVSIFQ